MHRIPLYFLIAAAACMVGGVAMGIGMGITHNFQLAPVHAHANLLGWTSLSLMGLVYRAYPQLCANRAAAVMQFALSTTSALCFPAGIYLSIMHEAPGLAIAASLVWMAGALMFLTRLVLLALAGLPRRLPAMQPAE
jgi:cbb3-type cytochrome oxidase subunit 1